ncbi:MAG: UDP-glucose/GDP-mannose dehydrogenase family protein [Cytophagales bacterium]|nr:MAG: UDP-glucose/GDP-mannose dehydrogenase family protein [Cytophagales bacterium]TAF62339.1 MAG: UDP-glucose/GDP-mannose dehydrogenase family protein [Cytophagales bacterium]
MKIAVVGTGYVGLVSGTCFAETGNVVTCVDIDAGKVERLSRGEITIYEPGLDTLFERNLKEGRLHFTTNLASAIEHAEIIFLALPTPPGEDGSADLSYVLGVAQHLGKLIKTYKVIVDKSTVPVGTAERVHKAIAENATTEFDVVSNPEFLREGAAIEDFMKPDRIVIGTSSARAEEVMRRLYAPFVRQGNPIIIMDERSAEMTKYAANAYLATRITFMNEIANLCDRVGANVDAIRKGIGTDKRIGPRFLFPGVGYGGSCFPKDVQALGKTALENGYDFRILTSVMSVNDHQRTALVRKVKAYFKDNLKGLKIAVWGLAFKPNTDDIREAPALYTIDMLLAEGVQVVAYDPEAMPNVQKLYGQAVQFAHNAMQALEGADALLILTEWGVFRTPDFTEMAQKIKNKVIFDGRNLYEVADMRQMGWYYESIGRP